MKTSVLVFATCCSLALAAPMQRAIAAQPGRDPVSDQQRALERLKRTGGKIVKPGSQRGTIALVDTQSRLAHSNLVAVAADLNRQTQFNVIAMTATAAAPQDVLRTSGATLAVIVVDDADTPSLLIAPEDKWACVNVSKLGAGLKSEAARTKFFESRGRRELYRAFSLLCGGGASQFDNNLTTCASQLEMDLCEEMIPMDVQARYLKYLPKVGVTQRFEATYSRACREGWAPQPTNEFQKAVWDRIHELPKKPLKLEK